jgi:hypothetical protein
MAVSAENQNWPDGRVILRQGARTGTFISKIKVHIKDKVRIQERAAD